ncbi:CCR4-NOT transcription complex subunit 3-like [Paramacrobiotus metropolitanus]|uniref:CCR4-NOT transcription complex subunit 3-like n=1 Tax=Paramacrobiotus metropolitanus TaxID=2943436 RepID=UPI002445790F|nr:CCR4-NOT transcription complex subunit 3-like [Paramacrobiotus metropolitanus]
MSDKRKLLAEVDRTFKKIYEGIEIFDEIWAKLQDASNPSLKEKFGEDLKKEIKKLQRLRDQVKTWISSSNELKDKEPLLKARRDIETKMEKFKDIEREAKIKLYSDIGLAQEIKVDVSLKKKHDARAGLSQFIEKMQRDLEQFESEMEVLTNGGKKKKVEKEKLEKAEFLKQVMESHRNHIGKIEIMLRMVDNDSINPDFAESVTDDFDFYLSKVQEGHLEDVTYIYAGIDLEEATGTESRVLSSPEPSVAPKEAEEMKVKVPPEITATEPVTVKPASSPALTAVNSAAPQTKPVETKPAAPAAVPPKPMVATPNPTAPPALLKPYAAVVARAVPQTMVKQPLPVVKQPLHNPPVSLGKPVNKKVSAVKGNMPAFKPKPPSKVAAALMRGSAWKRPHGDSHAKPQKKQSVALASQSPSPIPTGISGSSYTPSVTSSSPSCTPEPLLAKEPLPEATQLTIQNGVREQHYSVQPVPPPSTPPLLGLPRAEDVRNPWSSFVVPVDNNNASITDETLQADCSRSQSRHSSLDLDLDRTDFTPLGSLHSSIHTAAALPNTTPRRLVESYITRVELESQLAPIIGRRVLGLDEASRDILLQHSGLEAALGNPPKPSDSERRRSVVPCVPCPIPTGWPASPPLALICDRKFYANLATDVLFYIFYFGEGSLAQLFAATALKEKYWRFHKKLNSWFRRLEEPVEICDQHERGNYVLWDLDTWSEQEKEDFTFEYCYLENVNLDRYDHSADYFSWSAVPYFSVVKDSLLK